MSSDPLCCPACLGTRVLPGPFYDPAARVCLDCGWRARPDDKQTKPRRNP